MQCKFCTFTGNEENLIRHYELHHRRPHHWPCVHSSCVCVFKTRGALKSHLSRFHSKGQPIHHSSTIFKCELCDFHELCSKGDIIKHLGNHLKIQETIQCPFLDCQFKTNSYSGFSSHRSRKHKRHTINDLRTVLHSSASESVSIPEVTSEASTSLQGNSGSCSGETPTNSLVSIPYESIEHKIAKHLLSLQTVLTMSACLPKCSSGNSWGNQWYTYSFKIALFSVCCWGPSKAQHFCWKWSHSRDSGICIFVASITCNNISKGLSFYRLQKELVFQAEFPFHWTSRISLPTKLQKYICLRTPESSSPESVEASWFCQCIGFQTRTLSWCIQIIPG